MTTPRNSAQAELWPALPYEDWKDTCTTLHLWTQIVGKVRLAQTPWANHSWHVTLYLIGRPTCRLGHDAVEPEPHPSPSNPRRRRSRGRDFLVDPIIQALRKQRRLAAI